MAEPMIEGSLAIKWRDSPEKNIVSCYLAPTDEPDPTDEWLPILTVNRQLLEDDNELYEELKETVSAWIIRIYKSAGVDSIQLTNYPGGMPSMDGAS